MNADTRKATVSAAHGEPWRCRDCDKQQELVTSGSRSWYSNSGWYWVQLRPGQKPVYLCIGCFDSYNDDWPDYVGTHESSPWHGGTWEGKWLWVLPADYFERRDAYRRLPHWERVADGMKLVDQHDQILGRVRGYAGDARKKGLYQALDAEGKAITGPLEQWRCLNAIEASHGLVGPEEVRR